jgi:hypothetical protein
MISPTDITLPQFPADNDLKLLPCLSNSSTPKRSKNRNGRLPRPLLALVRLRNRKRCAVLSLLLCNTSPKLLALSASKHYFLALATNNNSSTCSRTNAIRQKRKPEESEEEEEEEAAWSSHPQKGKQSARKQEEQRKKILRKKKRCNAPAAIDPGSKTRAVVVERASRSPPVQPKTKTKTGNQRIHNKVQADCQRI